MEKSLMGGEVLDTVYDGWLISWEFKNNYRYWCRQKKINQNFKNDILIIMLNPGSLSGFGEKLGSDTSLRILRVVFDKIPANCLVTNLFDYATTKPFELYSNWSKRDRFDNITIYDKLNYSKILGYLFAYGDNESNENAKIDRDIKNRIIHIKKYVKNLKEINYFKNSNGTPKHPYVWQTGNIIPNVRNRILKTIFND